MRKHVRLWAIAIVAVVLCTAIFYSRSVAAIPEWRIQVVDEDGKPLAGVVVHQEWIGLESDGMTWADSEGTDADGWVVLPSRRIRESVALRIQDYFLARSKGRKSLLSTHAYVCWQGRTGEIRWEDLRSEPVHRLQLYKGGCGYG
jgi:hypothetical protein